MMKTQTFVLLLCITIALGFERRFFNRFDFDNDDDDGYELSRRRANNKEQFLELRTMMEFSRRAETGIVVTLENGAAMTTRLRILYTDDKCIPFLEETGRVLASQTKELTLPANAKNIKVIVEKEIFIDTWREVYNGTVQGQSSCIRITGLTFSSGVGRCN